MLCAVCRSLALLSLPSLFCDLISVEMHGRVRLTVPLGERRSVAVVLRWLARSSKGPSAVTHTRSHLKHKMGAQVRTGPERSTQNTQTPHSPPHNSLLFTLPTSPTDLGPRKPQRWSKLALQGSTKTVQGCLDESKRDKGGKKKAK